MPERVQPVGHRARATEAACDDARAAVELLAEREAFDRLERERARLEDRAMAAGRHTARLDEVADDGGMERYVERLPHRIDAAGDADDRVDLALPHTELALVAPEE